MVNSRFQKFFEYYDIQLYSKYFCAAFVYLMALSLHVDPDAEVFCLNTIVRGHYIYKDIWSSIHGEELHCKCNIGNVHDLYAVSVIKHRNGYCGPPS